MTKQIEKLQTTFQKEKSQLLTKQYNLQNDLNIAQSELIHALEEVKEIKCTMEDLSKEVVAVVQQSKADEQQLKLSHAEQMATFQKEAKDIQSFLEMDKQQLEQSLQTEQGKMEELRDEYNRFQTKSAADMTLVKQSHTHEVSTLQKEILFHRIELDDRNGQIEELEREREHVRVLAGIQWGIVKTRVKNRYRKIFRRGKIFKKGEK